MGIAKEFVYKVPDREPTAPSKFIAIQFHCGRFRSKYFLFDPSLRGRRATNVRIFRSRRGTAYIVRPGGDLALLVLEGSRMTGGYWFGSVTGHYITKVLAPQEWVLQNITWRSRGGGLSATLLILAVPVDLKEPIKLAKILIKLSAERGEERVLLSNGAVLSEEELEAETDVDELVLSIESLKAKKASLESEVRWLNKKIEELQGKVEEQWRLRQMYERYKKAEVAEYERIRELRRREGTTFLSSEASKVLRSLIENYDVGAPIPILLDKLAKFISLVRRGE